MMRIIISKTIRFYLYHELPRFFFCVYPRFLRAGFSNLVAIGKKTTWKTYPCKWKSFPYKRRSSPRTWKAFPYRFFLIRRKFFRHHWHFRVSATVIFRHSDRTQTPLGRDSYNYGTVLLQLWDDTRSTMGQYFHAKQNKQKLRHCVVAVIRKQYLVYVLFTSLLRFSFASNDDASIRNQWNLSVVA